MPWAVGSFLILVGGLAIVAGVALLARFRPFRFRWSKSNREIWRELRHAGKRHPSLLKDLNVENVLEEVRRWNPQLAAQAARDLGQLKEIEASKEDPYKDARDFTRIVDRVGQLAIGLLVLGGAAVIGGALWL